jgi:B-cell receptor-associated protein 31
MQTSKRSRGSAASQDQGELIEELQQKLAEANARESDFGSYLSPSHASCVHCNPLLTATLKKQAAQQAAEYDRLATKYNEATGQVSNKRTD